jgi:glycosyltransferase involved in cell wall biosynthesis
MITIIITCLNDSAECLRTVQSIRSNSPDSVQIVVVDDGSHPKLALPADLRADILRKQGTEGVGPGRHSGALRAITPLIMFVDSHMRFSPGWYSRAIPAALSQPHTAFCCTCVSLRPENTDLQEVTDDYFGGTWNFYGKDANDSRKRQVFEAVWARGPQPESEYEVSALLGANYIMHRERYLCLGGLQYLQYWGGDEQLLSLKFWLSGGSVRLLKDVRIGHICQQGLRRGFGVPPWAPEYNKLFIMRTILPPKVALELDRLMGHHPHVDMARCRLASMGAAICRERELNQQMLPREFRWLLDRFSLSCPGST